MHVITAVEKGSVLDEMGIKAGDTLVSINGQSIADVFDYRFLCTDEEIEVLIRKKNGEEWLLEIEKDEYEDLGAEFAEPMMAKARACANKCVFCFIDQLPRGMRAPLYFKDDDVRLSFLSGNYVTLTNIDDSELERLLRYRLSPVNVSVHTTNPALRAEMLGNAKAVDIIKRLERVSGAGVEINCQIVLVKGMNDGGELVKTLHDLVEIEGVGSVSVVPVGLTKHREELAALEPFGKEDAADVLAIIRVEQERALKAKGTRFVYAADEFYLKAGEPFPDCDEYDDFPQLENGVGMAALFERELEEALETLNEDCKSRSVSIVTGRSAEPFIKKLAGKITEKFTKTEIRVIMVENSFFGEKITVSGLLTGRDIMDTLIRLGVKGRVLLPQSCLKAGTDMFLDDLTVEDLCEHTGAEIVVVPVDGDGLLTAALGITEG